ncbi:MAG: SDR family oxidoreductase [Tepidisphaeraceae bacterium]
MHTGPHPNPLPAVPGEGTKIAIVTGAGRGIGRATAIELSQRGYVVVLVARTESQLDETALLCPGETVVLPTDVRDAAAVASNVSRVIHRFGRVDALVNNAGLAPLGPFLETVDQYNDVLATNLGAAVRFTQAVWPTMLRQKAGVVVNLSSYAARDPFPGFSLYAAAKAAVNGFTTALAKEAEPAGIRVHAVAPAGVETEMLRKIAAEDVVPPESTLTPQAVAKVIAGCVTGDLAATSGETVYLHKS